MRPQLIISDIDGTLAHRSKITDRTWEAVTAVRAAGIPFALATGRAVGLLGPVFDRGYDGIAICDNGAVTYDAGRDQVLACELIEADVVTDVIEAISQAYPRMHLGLSRIVPTPRSIFSEPRQLEVFDFGQQALDVADFGAVPAAKIWVVDRGTPSSQVAQLIAPIVAGRLEIAWSNEESNLIEMTLHGVSKATGCAALARRWGIDPADVVVMGDQTNDLPMLEWAGTAIVPANGSADAKARATTIVGGIEEDGTAQYLESLL